MSRQFAKELKIDGTRIAVLTIGQFGVCFYHGVELSGIQSRLRPCQAHKAKKTRHLLTVLSKEGAARPSEVRAMLGKRPRAEQAKAGSMSRFDFQPPSYKIFDTPAFEQIAAAMRAEQQALQDREFMRNLTVQDMNFLQSLRIKWSKP